MKRLTILNICLLFTMVSSFAQTVLETYDVNDDEQTTVILRDSMESDEDILDKLDLDDYVVGEEVYITAEMWAEIQQEQKKTSNNELVNPVLEAEVPQEIMVQEKSVVQAAAKPAKVTQTTKAKNSSAKKKKAKKKKRSRMKKSKRRKGGNGSRGGRMACYSF